MRYAYVRGMQPPLPEVLEVLLLGNDTECVAREKGVSFNSLI